ncbi:MAG TPA: TonB-dependent receptor plug domain-containing protein, partial [Thermoanaerobaculia bacterium]
MKHIRLFFIFLFAVPAFAQSTTTQPAATASDEIVVTASALPESVETTPAAATVITREEIEQRQARDVADVLREVPGVVISRTGSQGHAASMFIRGGSSKQALVLWNGIEINNAYFSAYNLGQLSTAGVEKVEVVRGPYSALYGSDAVSGVVNVLTTPARNGATIDVEAGEHGLLNAALSGALAGSRWNAHGAIERRQDDGFAANDDFRSLSILGGATFEPFDGASVGVLARVSDYDLGIPFNVNGTFTNFVPTLRRREDGRERHLAIPLRYESGSMAYEVRLSEHHRDDHFEDPDAPFGGEFA